MEIARKNDIRLVVDECQHKGECRGTCPRCEAELRYLEEQLQRRQRLKRAVAVAGISVGMVAALSGCSAIDRLTDAFKGDGGAVLPTPTPTEEIRLGEVAPAPTPTEEYWEEGEVPADPDLLMGKMPVSDFCTTNAPSPEDW